MKAVCIVGYPLAGKEALAKAVAARGLGRAVTVEDFRRVLDRSSSHEALAARSLVTQGETITPHLVASLWIEASPRAGDVIFAGFPRDVGEIEAYRALQANPIWVVYLAATPSLINRRSIARGHGPVEQNHPGWVGRLTAVHRKIRRMAEEEGRLIEIDAAATTEVQADALIGRLWPR